MQVLIPYTINDAAFSSSTAGEADYAVWSASTAYAVGTRCIRTQTHRIYERVIAGTTVTAPESDPTNWADVGPTNRWAMFDQAPSTSTSVASPLTVTVALGAFDTLVLLGVVGTTLTITAPGVNRTVPVPVEAVAGQGSTMVITGMAGTAGSATFSLSGTGTVKVGTFAVGTLFNLGTTSGKPTVGATDYSTKTFDKYGNADLVKRPIARRMEAQFVVSTANLDQAVRVLTALRSKAVVWIGLAWVDSTVIYGFAKEWTVTVRSAPSGRTGLAVGKLSILGLAFGVGAGL